MDVLLENLNDKQVAAFRQLAEQLNVGLYIYARTEANEDFAFMRAMQEAQQEGILSPGEKASFRQQLRES